MKGVYLFPCLAASRCWFHTVSEWWWWPFPNGDEASTPCYKFYSGGCTVHLNWQVTQVSLESCPVKCQLWLIAWYEILSNAHMSWKRGNVMCWRVELLGLGELHLLLSIETWVKEKQVLPNQEYIWMKCMISCYGSYIYYIWYPCIIALGICTGTIRLKGKQLSTAWAFTVLPSTWWYTSSSSSSTFCPKQAGGTHVHIFFLAWIKQPSCSFIHRNSLDALMTS